MQPQSGQYDFIVNPTKPTKPNPLSPLIKGNPVIGLVVIVSAVILALIFLIIIVSSLSKNTNIPKLTVVAQQQNELIRVSTLATATDQGTQQTKDFAQASRLSITTDQNRLIKFLATSGTKLSTRTLGLTKNSASDSAITNSAASGNFDSTYDGIMENGLHYYETAITLALSSTKNLNEKQLLSGEYSSAQLLLQQLNTPNP